MTPDQGTRQHLKNAYLDLSNWQNGVGEVDKGINASALTEEEIAEITPEQVLASMGGSKDWAYAAQQELGALRKELKEFGL